MSLKKGTLIKLRNFARNFAYTVLLLTLCRQMETFLDQIVISVCFGIIMGTQCDCIGKNNDKKEEPKKNGDNTTEDGSSPS